MHRNDSGCDSTDVCSAGFLLSGAEGSSVVPPSGCDFWSLGCEDSEAVVSGLAFSDGFVSGGEADTLAGEVVPVVLDVVEAVADVFPLV